MILSVIGLREAQVRRLLAPYSDRYTSLNFDLLGSSLSDPSNQKYGTRESLAHIQVECSARVALHDIVGDRLKEPGRLLAPYSDRYTSLNFDLLGSSLSDPSNQNRATAPLCLQHASFGLDIQTSQKPPRLYLEPPSGGDTNLGGDLLGSSLSDPSNQNRATAPLRIVAQARHAEDLALARFWLDGSESEEPSKSKLSDVYLSE
jgi:hypothetical protein